MPLDGLFLHFLLREIQQQILGSRVEKLHQPSKEELVLLLRSRNGATRLRLSAASNGPRVNLTQSAPENPKTPPMFCMLMRKYLTGAILREVRQSGLDRVAFFCFDGTNEIGDRVKYTLSAEIMAKQSNVILLDENDVVIDSVKRIDFTKSEIRPVMPGVPYVLPPSQGKRNILSEDAQTLVNQILYHKDKTLSAAILAVLEGFSPLICREITHRMFGKDVKVKDFTELERTMLTATLQNWQAMLKSDACKPIMLLDAQGKPTDFAYTEIQQYGKTLTAKEYGSYSELLEDFYYERDRLHRASQRAGEMTKVVANATARAARKLQMRREELAACADREQLRVFGELLNANQHRIEKGSLYFDAENYYDNNAVVRIALDPALSPNANSQKYYKEYRKAKTAEGMLKTLIADSEQELQYLESVADALARANSWQELAELRAELVQAGYLKDRGRAAVKNPKPLPPIEYVSPDGFRILVGRNNALNDRLSLKIAGKTDLWLHTQKIPGSHIVVLAENREITPATIELAAAIAARHSKAAGAALVPVDYTPARNLKKPPGAKPGKVIYHVYNTLWINPAAAQTLTPVVP